jgi:hypothetical protein
MMNGIALSVHLRQDNMACSPSSFLICRLKTSYHENLTFFTLTWSFEDATLITGFFYLYKKDQETCKNLERDKFMISNFAV